MTNTPTKTTTTASDILAIAKGVSQNKIIQVCVPQFGWVDVAKGCFEFNFLQSNYRVKPEGTTMKPKQKLITIPLQHQHSPELDYLSIPLLFVWMHDTESWCCTMSEDAMCDLTNRVADDTYILSQTKQLTVV